MDNEIREDIRTLRKENNDAHADIFRLLEKQNGRVRELEKWRSFITGGLCILSFAVIALATLFAINM